MNRSFVPSLLALALVSTGLLSLAPRATAGPLDSSQVAAGAKWVMHFDCEAMRESDPGKMMRAKWLSRESAQQKLAEMSEKIGMDPSKDIVDVTLYNNDFQRDRGVVLIEVSQIDGQKALAHLREKHPEVRMSTYEGNKLYTWKMPHPKGGQEYITSTLVDGSVIVMSSELPKVMEAIDILSGKLPGLSSSSPLAAAAPEGTIILMRGTDMKGAKLPGKCPVLKQAEGFSFVGGQNGDKLFANTVVVADSEEVAGNVASVVNGFRALGALRYSGDKDMMGIIAGLKTSVEGKTVSMEWHADAATMMKTIAKMKKKYGGKHGKRGWWKKHRRHHHDKDRDA